MGIIFIFFALVGIAFLLSLDWRTNIKAVFLILVIEGALRKWLLPQASDLIYFLKDFVLLVGYLKFVLRKDGNFSFNLNIINIIILIVSGWCLVQVFNPSLGSPIVGILGLRGYLLYIPLIWVSSSLFKSVEDLYKFLRLNLFLVIPVGLIGILQFFSPASSPINAYAWQSQGPDVATFGVTSAVRITGTFSYLYTYSSYLLVCFSLLVIFVSINQSRLWRWLTILELILVVINLLMTGSRGPVSAAAFILLSYLVITVINKSLTVSSLLRRFILLSMIFVIVATIYLRPAINSFTARATVNKDLPGRVSDTLGEPFEFFQYKGVDAYGVGATSYANPSLRRLLNLQEGEQIPTYYEEEMGRVALELGPIGFFLWYGLRLTILYSLWRVYIKLKTPFLRHLALGAFLIQGIQIIRFLVFDPIFVVYYWFFSGFIFLLPRLEKSGYWIQRTQNIQDPEQGYLPGSLQ